MVHGHWSHFKLVVTWSHMVSGWVLLPTCHVLPLNSSGMGQIYQVFTVIVLGVRIVLGTTGSDLITNFWSLSINRAQLIKRYIMNQKDTLKFSWHIANKAQVSLWCMELSELAQMQWLSLCWTRPQSAAARSQVKHSHCENCANKSLVPIRHSILSMIFIKFKSILPSNIHS